MKLRVGKKRPPERSTGRQRRQTTYWQRPASFSYHEQRSERAENPGRQAPNATDKRRQMLSLQYWSRRSGMVFFLIVALVCLVSIISLSNNPRIVFLDSSGSNHAFHTASVYQSAAAKQLSSSLWNKNKITFDAASASDNLRAAYPELSSVTISLPLIGHRPIYYLQADAPAFVLQSVNGSYVLDSSGKALLAKDSVPASVIEKLPEITDQTGTHVQLGKQIISSSEAQFIQVIVDTLAAKQVTIASLMLPVNSVQELDIHVAGKAYVVKFNMHDSASVRQQVGTYLATSSQLAKQGVTPAQYIDVRVPGRAYYK